MAAGVDLFEDLSRDLVLEDVPVGNLDLVDVLGCLSDFGADWSSLQSFFCLFFYFEDCLGCVDTCLRRLGYLLFSGGPFIWSSLLGSGFCNPRPLPPCWE